MNRQIIDEKMGIRYTPQDNYYLPDLALPTEEEQSIGVWVQSFTCSVRKFQKIHN